MNYLVIPSIRQRQLSEFFDAWKGLGRWDRVIVMEDNDEKTFDVSNSDRPVEHYSHAEVANDLGLNSWIISRKDSACRCYGLYQAWKAGAKYILTLDDDVRPAKGFHELMQYHTDNLRRYPRFISSVPGLSPRGMPSVLSSRSDVYASMGVWQGVPDLYAKDMLKGYPTDYTPPAGTRLLVENEYAPICGMNLCLRREAIPLAYFPLQGEGQMFSRFDDIWMGLILKTGFDSLGWKIALGEPHIYHSRASSPVECAKKEAPGLVENDRLLKWFSELPVYSSTSPVFVAATIAIALMKRGESAYARTLGRALMIWAGLFSEGKT